MKEAKKMKKSVKLFYFANNNMGDELSKIIVEELFNLEVERERPIFSDMFAIGSILGGMVFSKKSPFLGVAKTILGFFDRKPLYIWGTGFITDQIEGPFFYRKNIKFNALRGKLSHQKVEKILGKNINPVYGDAGILASKLIADKSKITKKYKWGIIPHYVDKEHLAVKKLQKNLENSFVIDVMLPPKEVIQQIAECDYILSSSMHGLIIADSFNIPNHHILISDKVIGDNFKFKDYYSAFGVEHTFTNVAKEDQIIFSDEFMKEKYKITEEMVEKMKEDMEKAFPRQLKS